ncbi:MAG: hypothetical protein ACRDQ7_05175 [Haloechinothrix sp.]
MIAGRDGGYAVPVVNVVDNVSMRAVGRGRRGRRRSPVAGHPQTSVKTCNSIGASLLVMMARTAAEHATVLVGASPRSVFEPRRHHRRHRLAATRPELDNFYV